MTGYHTPFLDFKTDNRDVWIDWAIDKDHLSINYDFTLGPLWNATASIKLEYILRPIFEMLEKLALSQRDTAEETLACGLFCCALLSRNYSKRPDVFYLNLALGVRLATEMKEVFSQCFGWNNWPPRSFDKKASLPRAGAEVENRQLVPVQKQRIPLHGSRLNRTSDIFHGLSDRESRDTIDNLICHILEEQSAGLPFR